MSYLCKTKQSNMTTIKQFDSTNLKVIRKDIDAALKKVMEKHGIDLSIGNISFASGRFTTRLTGKVEVDKTNQELLKVPIFEVNGFNVGDTFTHNTKTMKVVIT